MLKNITLNEKWFQDAFNIVQRPKMIKMPYSKFLKSNLKYREPELEN